MADANQSAQELAEIMDRVNRDMAAYGKMTQSTANDLQDATMKAKTGLNDFTAGSDKAADAVMSVAKAGMAAAGAMYEGKKGAAAFNGAIDELSNAAKLAGAALTLLVPGGPIIKLFIAGITAAVTATAEYVKKSNEMADKLYSGYSKMAKSGAAASDGMSGVYKGAKKLGLSMNELEGYTSLIGDSSKDLALFAGSVFEGRKKFEDVGAAMEPYRKGLIAAGYTQEQINEGAMGYLKLQTRMGAAQKMTTDQLAEGAKKYLNEQDALAKVTGQTRKEMETNRERALQQQQFAAKIRELQKAGKKEEANELLKLNDMYSAMGPKMASAYQASVTGNLANADALDANIASNMEMMKTADLVSKGQMTAAEAAQATGRQIGKFNDEINNGLAQVNAGFGDYAEFEKARMLTEGDLVENLKKAEAERKKQGMDGAKAADGITDQYAENIKKQQELNKKMEDEVFKGIANAQAITSKLASGTEKLTGVFKTLTDGINRLLRLVGLGEKIDKGAEKQQEIDDVVKKLADAKTAQKSASTPEQKAAAAREVKFYEDKQKLLEEEKAVLAKEDKNAKLDEQVLKRAEDEVKLKKAAYDKAMETASVKQKLGFGLDKDQEKARTEMWEAVSKQRALQRNEGGARDKAREEAAKAAPAAAGTSSKSSGGAAPAAPGTAPAQPVSGGRGAVNPPTVGIEGGTESASDSKVDADKVLSFTERTGSKTAFEALDSKFKSAVLRAAEEYNAVTGKTIQINSAKRDPKDQERLYAETVAAGRPGVGPTGDKVAQPGRSLHEQGHAVDIQQYTDPAAIAAFNKQGLFQKVPNDKVHFQAKEGGVFSGPTSGYEPSITMHGTEAIIPLKDGAVPVSLTGGPSISLDESITDRMNEITGQSASEDAADPLMQVANEFKQVAAQMSQQMMQMGGNQSGGDMSVVIGLLQDLISATKNGVDVQQKILAVTY